MVELIPFAFEDHLVRVVKRGDEPWFVGKDVCFSLGITKYSQALNDLDVDERGTCSVGTPGGDQAMIVVSEPGVCRLVFRSRKPEAERFKRWLAHEVLPRLRKTGKYTMPGGDDEPAKPAIAADPAAEALRHRLDLVREARMLFGAARARSLWRQLGLPAVPPPPQTPRDEAFQCLRHLLDSPAGNGARVRDLLANALEDDEEARLMLLGVGIRVMPERDTFVVANRHAGLDAIFKPTAWSVALEWMRVLRRLPGAQACGPVRWSGPLAPGQPLVRGTLLPGQLLDEYAR